MTGLLIRGGAYFEFFYDAIIRRIYEKYDNADEVAAKESES